LELLIRPINKPEKSFYHIAILPGEDLAQKSRSIRQSRPLGFH
jgi:hypothetical protein